MTLETVVQISFLLCGFMSSQDFHLKEKLYVVYHYYIA